MPMSQEAQLAALATRLEAMEDRLAETNKRLDRNSETAELLAAALDGSAGRGVIGVVRRQDSQDVQIANLRDDVQAIEARVAAYNANRTGRIVWIAALIGTIVGSSVSGIIVKVAGDGLSTKAVAKP